MSNPFGSSASAFGQQSPFGNMAQSTPGFGAQSSNFGHQATQQTSGPVFGQQTQGSTFGQQTQGPAFGQQTSGPAFGQQASGSTFGQQTLGSTFGQQTSGSTFGQQGQGSTFGQQAQGSTFGQQAQGSTFGQQAQGAIFGQHTQASSFGIPSPSSFGQTVQTTGFGSGGFGSGSGTNTFSTGSGTTTGSFGTGTFGTGSGSFGGGSNITTVTATSGMFGGPTSTGIGFGSNTTPSSVFGSVGQNSTSPQNNFFGGNNAITTTASNTSVFGGAAFPSTSGESGFGRTNTTGSSGMFGTRTGDAAFTKNVSSGNGTGNVSQFGFGKTIPTYTSLFGGTPSPAVSSGGGSGVNNPSTTSGPNMFGTSATSSVGSGGFGGTGNAASGNKFMFNVAPASPASSSGIPIKSEPSSAASSNMFVRTQTNIQTDRNVFGGTTVKKEDTIQGLPLQTNEGIKDLSPPASKFLLSGTSENTLIASGFSDAGRTTLTTAISGSSTFAGNQKVIKSEYGKTTNTQVLFGKTIKREPEDGEAQDEKRMNLFGGKDTKQKETPRVLFGKPAAGAGQQTKAPQQTDRSRFTWRRQSESESRKVTRKHSDEGDEAPTAKRASQGRQMSMDETKVAIVCKNVPAKCNNALSLRKHFSKFGPVSRVYPTPNKFTAVIHFKTHEGAAEAKRKGRLMDKGLRPMEIFWSNYSPNPKFGKRKMSSDDQTSPSSAGPHTRPFTEKDNIPAKRQFKWERSEVDDELSSMAGTSDLVKEQIKPLSRPGNALDSQIHKPAISAGRRSSPVPVASSSETSVSSIVPTTKVDKESITKLMQSVSRNTSDKLQTLNLRDRILRHVAGTRRQANLATARVFVGACTDMCPERERYDREEKRRLHAYEILAGTETTGNPQVDHFRAVKEYSRSSADQEEPLPQELRTLPTLVMTMNYLLSNVADRGEDGSWGEWFDFLWDRTRGIRKEITQQQFCNPDSVELLEKCVRFHIFCAERLCEEDMHSFDAKINSENMTKCLQTLKEFYSDLEKKQNLYCVNEAEMRSYMVLMNLNEGDILRETQQLRPEVRNQPCIKFALFVYAALNSNNYVRFFRLVKNGSFLSACIMHRYFTQVRGVALNILMKAHRKGTPFPFDELVRILGFDDKAEAAQFCEFYGLSTEGDYVLLDKSMYIEPEDTWPPRRSPNLIESKRKMSIGEAIYGGPLPALNLPQPSNSFDQNGRYLGKVDVKASDLIDSPVKPKILPKLPEVPAIQQVVQKVQQQQQQQQFSNDEIKEIAKKLFWEVIDETCRTIGNETMQDVNHLLAESEDILNNLITEVAIDTTTLMARTIESEARALREKQQKAEREAILNKGMVVIVTEIIKEVTEQESLNMATAKIREIKEQLKKEQIERCTMKISDELLTSVVMEISESVSEDVFEKDVIQRLQQLADNEKCVKLQVAGRFLQKWKREYAAKLRMKRSMLEFPPSASMKLPTDQIENLIPLRKNDELKKDGFYVDQKMKLVTESPDVLLKEFDAEEKVLKACDIYQRLSHTRAWQPFDMGQVIGKHLSRSLTSHSKGKPHSGTVYWKLLVSVPDEGNVQTDHQADTQNHLKEWLRAKFSKGKPSHNVNAQNELVSLYKTDLLPETKGWSSKLAVCVRMVEGDVDLFGMSNDVTSFMGTTGIIFVLPPAVSEDPELFSWQAERQRLDSLLRAKPPNPALPMVIVCPVSESEEVDTDFLNQCLNLDEYFDNGMLSVIYVTTINYDEDCSLGVNVDTQNTNSELSESLQWLADQYPPQPSDLSFRYFRDFVENFLLEKFYPPVLYNLKQRRCQGYLHQEPNELVQLYNHLLDHLITVIQNPHLQTHSWPVSEFAQSSKNNLPPPHWCNKDYLDHLCYLIQNLQLPWFQNNSRNLDSWSEVCEDVWRYSKELVGDSRGSARVDFLSQIRVLLNRVRLEFQDICDLVTGENQCEPSYVNMPWFDLISACINFKMADGDYSDPMTTEREDLESMVVYLKSDLKSYVPPKEWKYLENDSDRTETISLDATLQRASSVAKNKVNRSKVGDTKSQLKNVTISAVSIEPLTETVNTANRLCRDLSSAIDMERKESRAFEEYLRKAMDQEIDSSAIPDISSLPEWSVFQPASRSVTISDEGLPRSPLSNVSLNQTLANSPVVERVSESELSNKLSLLMEEIQAHKHANNVFERQLQKFMDEGV